MNIIIYLFNNFYKVIILFFYPSSGGKPALKGRVFQKTTFGRGSKPLPNRHNNPRPLRPGFTNLWVLYRAQEGFVNLDSARQSTIEACGPNDEAIVKTMAEEEDRLGKAAASPNSLNLTERGIDQIHWLKSSLIESRKVQSLESRMLFLPSFTSSGSKPLNS